MNRRRFELAVLIFGALFVTSLILYFRPPRRPLRGSPAAEPLPSAPSEEERGEATTVLKGFDYTETLRGKPLFHIRSERTVGFGPAAGLLPDVYVLEKVTLTVYPEEGEPVTVWSDRAEYDQRTKRAQLTGNVRWSDQRGAMAETERVEFDPSRRALAAPKALHLTRGTFDLTARSGLYDTARREVVLEGPVQGTGTGEGSGGLTALSAEQALYRRQESLMELKGRVKASTRAGDRLAADRLFLKLEGESGRLQWARAEGRVEGVFVSSPTPANPRGGAGKPMGERPYKSDTAALLFGADGQAQSLSLAGSPAIVSDARGRVAGQTIEVQLQSGRATSASALGRVHVETDQNRADAERASLSFGGAGEVETLELSGSVRMQGEDRLARADHAVNSIERGIWILTSKGNSATVESGGSRISANRIEIDEKKRLLTAEIDARAVFTPRASEKPDGGRAPTLVGDPSRPTFGKAQKIVLEDASRMATLWGSASLWQEGSSLSGDSITLNDATRSVAAVGGTRTILVSSEATAAAKAKREESSPTIVTAHRVSYREGESKAVFDGSVTVSRGALRASAESATAAIGSDRKVERVEMSGGVSLADAGQGRSGRADRATDWPREGKTVLEGAPAWVVDGEGNRVAGAVLTITDRGRRVEVTAPAGGKTETIYRTRSS